MQLVSSGGNVAGMSAERTAALQRAQKNSPPHFVTKRVADPNMIPMLVAAGVEFGAVKVCTAGCITLLCCLPSGGLTAIYAEPSSPFK